MDPSKYKTTRTSRGITYNFFFSAAQSSKPYILFLHGFPSTSYDWHHQVDYFVKEGYGVIVPDLLGYGGTDKPADPEMYRGKLHVQDLVDILDAEKVAKVVVVGHDWGTYPASQIWQYNPERVLAAAYLAVGYNPPAASVDIEAINAFTKQALGYEVFGYEVFFVSEGADAKILEHLDSFLSMVFPGDPAIWKTNMAPLGALEDWITHDNMNPRASYMSTEEFEKHKASIAKYGIAGGLNWYKNLHWGLSNADDAKIPAERAKLTVPSFFGAAMKDYIALAQAGKDRMAANCTNATIKEYDTDHWVQLAAPEKLNAELHEWLKANGLE